MILSSMSFFYRTHKANVGNGKIAELEETGIIFQPKNGVFIKKDSEFHLN